MLTEVIFFWLPQRGVQRYRRQHPQMFMKGEEGPKKEAYLRSHVGGKAEWFHLVLRF